MTPTGETTPPRHRVLLFVMRTCTTAAAVLALVWIMGTALGLAAVAPGQRWGIEVHGGSLNFHTSSTGKLNASTGVMHADPSAAQSSGSGSHGWRWGWGSTQHDRSIPILPRTGAVPGVGWRYLKVPLWCFALPLAGAAVMARRSLKRKVEREARGCCPRCGYDRNGVVAEAPCPGCGKR